MESPEATTAASGDSVFYLKYLLSLFHSPEILPVRLMCLTVRTESFYRLRIEVLTVAFWGGKRMAISSERPG